ncbi:MAG TPA: heavy metal translocating P-type ATPase [Rhizomicrobium sp.]|nr:heavy metal translocating P-type ATPase [Rhizomicrobium sp.]
MAALTLPAIGGLERHVRRQAGTSTFELAVRGARCANCIAKIEAGVQAIPGVVKGRLNLSTGKLAVEWRDDAVAPQTVIDRLRALGYEAYPFEAASVADDTAREGRFLLRCLAVAGFTTVFVMGLTDAVWYGGTDLDAALRSTFFVLAAIVSVPLTLYAGQPFFVSAWRSLSKRATNMDVPIAAAILLSLGLSLYQTAIGGAHTYYDAGAMLVFLLLIGRYLDFRLRDRARGAARHLAAMQSALVRRLKPGGDLETVAAREVAAGDRVLLAAGERAPVDGTLEDASEADISLVTGESAPVKVAKGEVLRAGSVIIGRPTVLAATAAATDSLVADLARLLEAGQQARNLYVRLADRAARAYVPVVATLSLLVFLIWIANGAALPSALTVAITVLIVTCPCALGLAVPAVQIVATGRLFGRGLFVKSGDALERLAQIDMAVFDKTGTLTFGVPVLRNGSEIPPDVLEAAARLARASRHPLARALAAAAGEGPVALGVREVAGSGLEVGALRLGSAAWCGAAEDGQISELWFRNGASPPVRFTFEDALRPDAAQAVRALRQRRIDVEMLSGDRRDPAEAIARAAAITSWRAGVGPTEKAAHMNALRGVGHRALMVGDGLNDAGALALAHVSVAPGTAADASQLAADMVLRGDSLMPLVEAVDIARQARVLVLENFALAALYNAVAVPLAATGRVTPLLAAALMASSSLLVTLNALRLTWWRR